MLNLFELRQRCPTYLAGGRAYLFVLRIGLFKFLEALIKLVVLRVGNEWAVKHIIGIGINPSYNRYNGPHIAGRVQIGRISIANSDSEAHAYVDGAVDAADRAVNEQIELAKRY